MVHTTFGEIMQSYKLVIAVVSLFVVTSTQASDADPAELAHRARWEWDDDADNPFYCMLRLRRASGMRQTPSKYGATLTSNDETGSRAIRIGITHNGDEVYSWLGGPMTVFDVVDDTLYRSSGGHVALGAIVQAIDLTTGKLLWKTRLRGMGVTDHSAYVNRISFEPRAKSKLCFFGRESQGDYIEVLDMRNGERLSYRVVSPEPSADMP